MRDSEIKKKYFCIHCKAQFDEVPPKKGNECIRGYYHDLAKPSDIIWASQREFAFREEQRE